MVVGRDDVELELAVARCLKDSAVDLNFLYTSAVEFAKSCCDSRLLAGSGRTVDQKMWEVSALRLEGVSPTSPSLQERGWLLTNDLRRSDKSW